MPGFTSLGLGVPQASLFLNRRQDWKLLPPPSLSGLPGFQVRAARTFFCCIPEGHWQAQLRCWWQLTRTDARACLHMIPTLRGQRASLAFPRWPDWQLVEAGPSPRVVRCVWDYALSDRSPLELGFARACGEGLSCTISAWWEFPSGPVVENLPANAGDMGSIPGLGRFQIGAAEPWSPPMRHDCWSPLALEPVFSNKRRRRNKKPTHHNWRPLSTRCN